MAREVANWSGCYHCRPQHLLRPRSIAEVQSILREGTGPVKACNALPHSPNDIWTCEQGTMICLSTYLKEVVRADENSITVQGGMQVGVLHDRLVELGRSCFGSLPSVQTMTIAGAISTGAHGSDASYGPLSSHVVGLKLVLAEGEIVDCSRTHHPDLFRAGLCSLGAIGIIAEVTLATARQKKETATIKETIVFETDVNFAQLAKRRNLSKVYFSGNQAVVILGERVPGVPQPPWPWIVVRVLKYLEAWLFFSVFLFASSTLCRTLLALWYRLVYGQSTGALVNNPSSPILQIAQFTCEYALPVDVAQIVWQKFSKLVDAQPDMPLHFGEARFVLSDADSFISPSASRSKNDLFVYLGVVTYIPLGIVPKGMREMFETFGLICVEAGGRPHWAKEHKCTASDFAQLYQSNWNEFLKVRQQVDPKGRFLNDHLKQLFGIKNQSRDI